MLPATTYEFDAGTAPLLVSIPHLGTEFPADVRGDFADIASLRQDTDWHLDKLYAFVRELGGSVIRARVSRYVIDLNRPADGQSLYPGQTTTSLCPLDTFRGEPLYAPGAEPDAREIQSRLDRYWTPYHSQLRSEIERLKRMHGRVLLWDAHSIASQLPRLFEGQLPDLNLGTADGRSCSPALVEAAQAALSGKGFSHVVNGRFKGGHITRHYGAPSTGVHAIQLEMTQQLYMNEQAPFDYVEQKASQIQPVVRSMMAAALAALAKVA